MTRNMFEPQYLSFDIETAKILPDDAQDILSYRPLGISCASACKSDTRETITWYGKNEKGDPAPQMSGTEVADMIRNLISFVDQGYTLVTWNGLGFDFDVMAEESGMKDECVKLARNHIDMLFHAVCVLGHPVSLQKAAEGMEIPGKLADMSGAEAPAAWAAGKYKEVLAYVAQDAIATVDLVSLCEERREMAWITRAGKKRRMTLPDGWKNVEAALGLPIPDTSWMSDPPTRERFTSWMEGSPLR
jgi:hypothetical protein